MFDAKNICLLHKSHQIARLASHLINYFSKWIFTVWQEILLKLVLKWNFIHFFTSLRVFLWLYHSGFVHNFIWLNSIMQLKQFNNITTKVSSRKTCYYFWWSTWLFRWQVDSPHKEPVMRKCFHVMTFACTYAYHNGCSDMNSSNRKAGNPARI